MTTFKSWAHPSSGEVRIYINGLSGQKSSKVFVVERAIDEFGFDYDIRTQIPDESYVSRADLVNEAERAIFEACGERVKTFVKVKELV